MYQKMYISVIRRDTGDNSLISCKADLCGKGRAVVDGSILIVGPGDVAYVDCNGELSPPFSPGRYELLGTGVKSPFHYRLRHILTNSDPGTSLNVYFISSRTKFYRLGTGALMFTKRVGENFNFTMKAMAACSLSLSVADPLKLIKKLVGTYTSFGEEDVEACYNHVILTTIREVLSREINKLNVTEFNSHLTDISSQSEPTIRKELEIYSLRLESFKVNSINIPDDERQKLWDIERKYVDTDVELRNLRQIWGNDVRKRTLAEAMTGIPSRGQALPAGNGGVSPFTQMAMFGQAMNMAQRSGMFDGLTDLYNGDSHPDKEKKG